MLRSAAHRNRHHRHHRRAWHAPPPPRTQADPYRWGWAALGPAKFMPPPNYGTLRGEPGAVDEPATTDPGLAAAAAAAAVVSPKCAKKRDKEQKERQLQQQLVQQGIHFTCYAPPADINLALEVRSGGAPLALGLAMMPRRMAVRPPAGPLTHPPTQPPARPLRSAARSSMCRGAGSSARRTRTASS